MIYWIPVGICRNTVHHSLSIYVLLSVWTGGQYLSNNDLWYKWKVTINSMISYVRTDQIWKRKRRSWGGFLHHWRFEWGFRCRRCFWNVFWRCRFGHRWFSAKSKRALWSTSVETKLWRPLSTRAHSADTFARFAGPHSIEDWWSSHVFFYLRRQR